MRPTLNIIDDSLIIRILDEAKRVMSEIGMEICGAGLRQRLLDQGLKLDASGERVLFPAEMIEKAIASAPKTFTLFDRDARSHAEVGGNNVHLFQAPADYMCWIIAPIEPDLPILAILSNTHDYAMGLRTLPTLPLHFQLMMI